MLRRTERRKAINCNVRVTVKKGEKDARRKGVRIGK